jgi:outer membrane receptor protein involved in Fe transport
VWNAVTGEAILERIDISQVERIEVLRGPASVLFGTNAYTGAVNIVLRGTGSETDSVVLEAGSTNRLRAGASVRTGSAGFPVSVSGAVIDEGGRRVGWTDEAGETGRLREFMSSGNLSVVAGNQRHSLLVNGYRTTESYFGVTPKFASGAGNPHRGDGLLLSYGYRREVSRQLELYGRVAYDRNRRDLSRSFDDNTRADIDGHRLSGDLGSRYAVNDRLSFDLGLAYDHRESLAYTNYDVQSGGTIATNNMKGRDVSEGSLYAQALYERERLTLLVGSRFTKNGMFGSNIASRGTLVYKITPTNSVKFIAGQSYRAPSLFELYFETPTQTVFGNEDLEPERSTSVELAYLTSIRSWFLQALVYYADYDNKIFRVTDPELDAKKYINGGGFTARGLECELRYRTPAAADMFLNMSYVCGSRGDEYEGNDHYNFKYVSELTASSGVARRWGRFHASALVNYRSAAEGPAGDVGAAFSLDLNTGFTHRSGPRELQHVLSLKNVTGEDNAYPEYVRRNLNEIPEGFGRMVLYTMRFTF